MKAEIKLTFPECVNTREGPCEAWKGLVDQHRLAFDQGQELRARVQALEEWQRRALPAVETLLGLEAIASIGMTEKLLRECQKLVSEAKSEDR